MTEIARDIIDLYSEKAQLEEKEIADYEVMLQLLCGYRVESGRQLPAKYPVKTQWPRAARKDRAGSVHQ